MSQFGMHMPGARGRRAASVDVYTALFFVAFVALAVACGFMWKAASAVGVDGNAFGIQAEQSSATSSTIKLKAPG